MSYELLRRGTLISRYPAIPGIIARVLDMTKPAKTSYEASRSMRRRAMSNDGARYPTIYPSQVVVRRRKIWCDRGFRWLSGECECGSYQLVAVWTGIILFDKLL